jgi:hypothetical protein
MLSIQLLECAAIAGRGVLLGLLSISIVAVSALLPLGLQWLLS